MTTPELTSGFGTPTAADDATRRATTRILLWDLPLRIFHWSLVVSVVTAIVTGELGGPWMPWHGRAGLCIVGLLAFRTVWGIAGSTTARFASFAPAPRALLRYVRGQWRGVGHNPLGALSVFALLGLLAVQAATGLFGNDDIAFAGPLNALVDDTLGRRVTGWHRLLANGLFALLALHVLAIAFHAIVKRHDLVRPMITGTLDVAPGTPLPKTSRWRGGRAALLVAVALAGGGVSGLTWVGRGAAPVAASISPRSPASTSSPTSPTSPASTTTSKQATQAAPAW